MVSQGSSLEVHIGEMLLYLYYKHHPHTYTQQLFLYSHTHDMLVSTAQLDSHWKLDSSMY